MGTIDIPGLYENMAEEGCELLYKSSNFSLQRSTGAGVLLLSSVFLSETSSWRVDREQLVCKYSSYTGLFHYFPRPISPPNARN